MEVSANIQLNMVPRLSRPTLLTKGPVLQPTRRSTVPNKRFKVFVKLWPPYEIPTMLLQFNYAEMALVYHGQHLSSELSGNNGSVPGQTCIVPAWNLGMQLDIWWDFNWPAIEDVLADSRESGISSWLFCEFLHGHRGHKGCIHDIDEALILNHMTGDNGWWHGLG